MNQSLFETLCTTEHLMKAWMDVKAKRAGGGIDGETLATFEINLQNNLEKVSEELKAGNWVPQPYLRIEIPKKKTEKRQIGMLTVKDKVIQQAIRLFLEPRCERLFLSCSYGYRPSKGAVAAIKRVEKLCRKNKKGYAVMIDVDDFFNNVNHDTLEARVKSIMPDNEICRLIMLCVKMGVVTKKMQWQDVDMGLHQGAVLSPCLANLYLHSFDQFVTCRQKDYVRYADDFVIFCPTHDEAVLMHTMAVKYLNEKLSLTVNTPQVVPVVNGFKYLGLDMTDSSTHLSENKRADIQTHISEMYLTPNGLNSVSEKRWKGYLAYYGEILSQEELQFFDQEFYKVLERNIDTGWKKFGSSQTLKNALGSIKFMTKDFRLNSDAIKEQLVNYYLISKGMKPETEQADMNRKIVLQRKHEYQKIESQESELVVSKPGVALGLAKNKVTVKENGIVILSVSTVNLKHISILCKGISLSSNLLTFLIENKIPIDFYGKQGKHIGSFLSAQSFQCSLWRAQAMMPITGRNKLASSIIEGKLTNQLNLIKYFHKYHKSRTDEYQTLLDAMSAEVAAFKDFSKNTPLDSDDYIKRLCTFESHGALKYWAYVKSMLADDNVGFNGRVQQGATDIVNCMLNYGYAILFSRVWQALLRVQLNPYDSVIHVRQEGKPTFVFDVMELFRAQAVDRVVFTLVQKKERLEADDGLLTDDTKKLLAVNITERMQKREKYRGEEMSFDKIISRQASEIASLFAKNERYLPYKAKW